MDLFISLKAGRHTYIDLDFLTPGQLTKRGNEWHSFITQKKKKASKMEADKTIYQSRTNHIASKMLNLTDKQYYQSSKNAK